MESKYAKYVFLLKCSFAAIPLAIATLFFVDAMINNVKAEKQSIIKGFPIPYYKEDTLNTGTEVYNVPGLLLADILIYYLIYMILIWVIFRQDNPQTT